MTSNDQTWRHIIKHDVTWPSMMSNDQAWRRMTKHDVAWPNMTSHYSVVYDQAWRHMIKHDVTWSSLMSHDQTWCHIIALYMIKHDVTWSSMTSLDQAWCHMTRHDVTWSTTRPWRHLTRFTWPYIISHMVAVQCKRLIREMLWDRGWDGSRWDTSRLTSSVTRDGVLT